MDIRRYGRWLRYWLTTRVGIRPTTRLIHTQYIERFLIPHLGKIRLADLTVRQLSAFFAAVGTEANRFGQPHTPTTLAHIRTTLRAALNDAIREGLIRDNPARRVELPSRRRPHALVWTPSRVADWQQTGERPSVAVWTAAQLATFLDSVHEDRLHAMWWLLALRGLRRSEVAGLRWSDLDLDHRQSSVIRARTAAGYQVYEGPPKSVASSRVVALDRRTVAILRAHGRQQRQEQRTAGRHGGTPATCSPDRTAARCTRSTSPTAWPASSREPGYPRSGYTIFDTAPLAWPTPRAPT